MASAPIPVPTAAPPAQRPHARERVGGLLDETGELAAFSLRTLRALPGSLRYFSEIMRVNALITRRATPLLFVMCGFLGMSVANFGFFFLRSIGASDFVGILPGLVTPRQIAPQMFGYVFAGSVCCAIAAELGAARIQEEVDAYESQGIDPMQLLVGTRVVAVLLYVPIAALVAILGCLAGSYLSVVVILQGNTSRQFIDAVFSIFPSSSLFPCFTTVALITLQCVLVACFYGLRDTGGGPDAVGNAVARSVGLNLVLLHFVLSIAALVFYGGSLGVPIGD